MAMGNLAIEAIDNGLLTKEEYQEIFKGVPVDYFRTMDISDEEGLKEIKSILKHYANKIRKEMKNNVASN